MDEGRSPEWFVYLIEAENGFLYTGITKNLRRRFEEHRNGKTGAKFFRRSPPKKIIARTGPLTHSLALRLEARIKKLKKPEKLELKKRGRMKSMAEALQNP